MNYYENILCEYLEKLHLIREKLANVYSFMITLIHSRLKVKQLDIMTWNTLNKHYSNYKLRPSIDPKPPLLKVHLKNSIKSSNYTTMHIAYVTS